jgi:hypothetical protein
MSSRAGKSARSEIPEVFRGFCGAAVSAVVIAIRNQTRLHQTVDQANVSADVLA